jgi:hypothetical protein
MLKTFNINYNIKCLGIVTYEVFLGNMIYAPYCISMVT